MGHIPVQMGALEQHLGRWAFCLFQGCYQPNVRVAVEEGACRIASTCSTTYWHASEMQRLLCTVSVHTISHLLWRLSGAQREVCPGLLSTRLHARVGVQAGLCFSLCRGRDSWFCQLDVVSAHSFFELYIANQVCWRHERRLFPPEVAVHCANLKLWIFTVLVLFDRRLHVSRCCSRRLSSRCYGTG